MSLSVVANNKSNLLPLTSIPGKPVFSLLPLLPMPENEVPEGQRKFFKITYVIINKILLHSRTVCLSNDKTESLSTLARNIIDFDLLMKVIIWARFAVDNGTDKGWKEQEEP